MNDKDFSEVVACFKEAGKMNSAAGRPGRILEINAAAIRAVRAQLHLAQKEFAVMIGVSLAKLQSWEQGKSEPDGPAKALLTVAANNPEAVMEALHS